MMKEISPLVGQDSTLTEAIQKAKENWGLR